MCVCVCVIIVSFVEFMINSAPSDLKDKGLFKMMPLASYVVFFVGTDLWFMYIAFPTMFVYSL